MNIYLANVLLAVILLNSLVERTKLMIKIGDGLYTCEVIYMVINV